MRILNLLLIALLISSTSFAKEYHVSVNGKNSNDGSEQTPFKTITAAVQYAYPGDVVTVHAGVYREWLNPIRGGDSDTNRIVYRAAPGEKVEIRGSEKISGWKKERSGIWKVTVNNSLFDNYNPYQDSIFGDWFNSHGRVHHTGEIFLNEKSLYEKESLDKVINSVNSGSSGEESTYTWYCESNDTTTTIWANFNSSNPNRELVEISARPTCVYSDKPGINYITISGFHISQAATQWGAPTAEQIGMVATHWNKGWIIENNIISNSKCSGITLGKERSTGHNVWYNDQSIDGSIHYIETTFRALEHGWNRDNIGSHIVRNNQIFDCEQTGICGSMGAAFSIIENNHIYNIWTKRQFNGAEIGGIKFHAAIDATIRGNRIHNCGRGLWLDWMTQGTRVSSNIFYNNDLEDLFLEVNHGPFIVDNNIMLSASGVKTQSQGGAFVNNLITGTLYMWSELNRFTPYHLKHSTTIAGLSTIYSGDDRYYNNIFTNSSSESNGKYTPGLEVYNGAKLPLFIENNVYYNGAKPSNKDIDSLYKPTYSPEVTLEEIGDRGYLHITFNKEFIKQRGKIITTEILGRAKIPNAKFENPDGSPLSINYDIFGTKRSSETTLAGPFNTVQTGKNIIKLW